ncbi:MAG: DUF1493 family protein [Zoogloeaceae bacterium]|jgi:acyl carrier protein|nr:DUF1493 family protein [Zoogloeaceae bacterium]
MTEDIASQVIHFVADLRAESPDKITLSTTIGRDLGVDGDDAEDLIDAFSERFDVDVSEFWPVYHRYFGPEGCNPFWILYVLIMALFGRKPDKLLPLTIEDLINAAQTKKLDPKNKPLINVENQTGG